MRADDPGAPKQQIKRWVNLRMTRQKILNQDGVRFSAVLDEAVLRRPIGGNLVMAEQVAHVASVATRENVDIRVLPFWSGAHCGSAGAFTLIVMPNPFPLVAHIESPAGALFAESVGADDLADRYDRLYEGSLGLDESIDFLRRVEQELR
ncbi:DUF5753 domain-containing protein [Nocardiopsis sp. CNR-923]|uniref:DUF5753 domain-containing protein n=1 Tax=Nocardiopsis sp. CNR-923 TaxID=1904965 RepID=UPI0021CD026E|nr:DUF5753 domain-containing protein [Nocardiopsis sp. CNR-923]